MPSNVPPGRYNFEVVEATNCVSKTSKNQQIKLKLEVEGGVTVYDYLVFEKKSFWKIDQFRTATGDNLETDQEVDFDASDCTGRFGFASLTVETWEGKTRNKVAEYLIEEKKGF